MADQSQGPGWWVASDGRWYPPDQAPAVPPPETWAAPSSGSPPPRGLTAGARVALAVGAALVGILVVVGVAALAIGSDSTGAVPDGYAVIEGDGVSIAVPEDWREVEPDDFAMSEDELERAFPDAPEGLLEQGAASLDQGAALVAFEVTDDFASNVNILELPGEAPLGEIEPQVEAQLRALGARIASTTRVGLPIGDALRVSYTVDVATPDGGSVPATGVQLYVPHEGSTYVITVSTDGGADDILQVAGDTFRVG
jgi:hypothetical protein